MSLLAAIPGILQVAGGLFRGGAAKTVARLQGQPVAPKGSTLASTAASAGAGALGAVVGPGLVNAAGSGLVSAGQGMQSLVGGMRLPGPKTKKRRRKGISATELRGFRRVYNFLESHCEPRLKVKRTKKCR